MPIICTKESLFNISAEIKINTVNCVGIMGAGIALAFKQKYPEMFLEYQKLCKSNKIKIGELHIYEHLFDGTIINFPTKDHWKNKSEYSFIQQGLVTLAQYLKEKPEAIVAIPALGCNNGGLDWNKVKEMIISSLTMLPNTIYLCEPLNFSNVTAKQ